MGARVRRLVVAVWIAGVFLLGLGGLLASPVVQERFTAKTFVIRPDGPDGLRVTEYVDLDTGSNWRRGFFRELPLTLGTPTDITATSPNAPSDLRVERLTDAVLIRVGNPDVTVRGRFRYVLEYVYPQAGLANGQLALDLVGDQDTLPTERITVHVTGIGLRSQTCFTGRFGSVGACDLEGTDTGYVMVTSLDAGEGLFVGGAVSGQTTAAEIAEPALPEPREFPARWPRAVALALAASGALMGVWWVLRRRGRNDVAGSSATDAAFGAGVGSRTVTDGELSRLATLEVAPPEQLTPWEGAVLLHEAVNDRTVEAWWGHAAAQGRIDLSETAGHLVISDVADAPRLSDGEEAVLRSLFTHASGRYEVAGYDPGFASVWSDVAAYQSRTVDSKGWWHHPVRRAQVGQSGALMGAAIVTAVALGVLLAFGWANRLQPIAALAWLGSLVGAMAVVVIASCVIGLVTWWSMGARRSAVGSAMALRTLSFRKFLLESEGRHVEEAWKRGVLREYTAWAVALDAADTWRNAAFAARMPVEATASLNTSALLLSHRRDFSYARSSPSSSSSSGGGSSFGGLGSGGGGGRSGSW